MGSKKPKLSAGTFIERDLFESPPFLALRGFAPQLLILILGKRWFDTVGKKRKEKRICTNCDALTFTYIEAEKNYGITKTRLSRAYDELLAKGFLTIKHQGGGYKQDKSVYALIEKWIIWRPGTIFEKRKKDPVQRGFRKPKRRSKTSKNPVALVTFKQK